MIHLCGPRSIGRVAKDLPTPFLSSPLCWIHKVIHPIYSYSPLFTPAYSDITPCSSRASLIIYIWPSPNDSSEAAWAFISYRIELINSIHHSDESVASSISSPSVASSGLSVYLRLHVWCVLSVISHNPSSGCSISCSLQSPLPPS